MVAKTKEAPTADVVSIDDIGPIEHLEIPCPPGHIVVLTGPNGGGKTTALDAIDALTTRNGTRLENRDGTLKGQASFAGVTIKVGRGGANRRLVSDEKLAVATLEDDLNLDDLVDPGQKDQAAADVRRIKALAKVCGVTLPLGDLQELVGGAEEFGKIVDVEKLQPDDVIGSIEKIKRDIEGAARLAEQTAVNHFTACKSKLAENEGIDLDGCCDEQNLQQQYEAALNLASDLKSRSKQHAEQMERMLAAESKLAEAVKGYTGPSADDAAKSVVAAEQSLITQETLCRDLERQLLEATSKHKQIADQVQSAKGALSAAQSHEAALAGWQQTIESAVAPAPTDAELAATEQAVQSAREATSTGVLIRAAIKRKAEADDLDAKAAEARGRSEKLRDAAQATLDVLASSVSKISDRLSINSDFRLVVTHPKRGETYFSDLSSGEKWTVAIDIAIEACVRKGERCVFVARQEAWEGLDGRNRKLIIDHIAQTQATMYTAEASKVEDPQGGVGYEVLGAK